MIVYVSYWCAGPSTHPFPLFSGVDASDVYDMFAVDNPALIAHYDALAYDVSFRSWEWRVVPRRKSLMILLSVKLIGLLAYLL